MGSYCYAYGRLVVGTVYTQDGVNPGRLYIIYKPCTGYMLKGVWSVQVVDM